MIVDKTYQRTHNKWLLTIGAYAIVVIVISLLGIQYDLIEVKHLWISAIGLIAGVYLWSQARPHRDDVAKHIHQFLPSTEYSLDLLEKPSDQLNTLETIQVEKINNAIQSAKVSYPINTSLIKKLGILTALIALGVIGKGFFGSGDNYNTDESITQIEQTVLEQSEITDSLSLLSTTLSINPPTYTGRVASNQRELETEVLEGSKIRWNIRWSGQEEKAILIYEEDDEVLIENGKSYSREFYNPSYYRYKIEGEQNTLSSPYASIKVIQDEVSRPQISGINEYQRLEYKENYNIDFDIEISDDHGIDQAYIIATVAKGQGESVKFREKKFELDNFETQRKDYKGAYSFSTAKLEMEPGDELYFHVVAKDNCPYREQWSKSPTHFVMLEDTATYFFAEDQGMQVDLMPDFFRSQRQIIIDTEQLLSEQKDISTEEFNQRSNELGFDQKLLRLKYGQFLGEESESGIAIQNEIEVEEEHEHDHEGQDHEGHDHDHDHDHKEPSLALSKDVIGDFMHDHDHEEEHGSLMAKGTEKEDPTRPSWVEELSHNHDNMEEATFHKIATKTKLKAALSEMWDAELHLRLYDPKASLPYQNKSLLLLQEIKNHARIYVHRIGFDPPVIKEAEQRLSGDLDEIISPTSQHIIEVEDIEEILKKAYQHIADDDINDNAAAIEAATNVVASQVVQNPNLLPLLADLQAIIQGTVDALTMDRLKTGLALLINQEESTPTAIPVFNHPITSSSISALRKTR